MNHKKYLYSLEEAANYLKTDITHVHQMIADGNLPLMETDFLGSLEKGYFEEPWDAINNPSKWRFFESIKGKRFRAQFVKCLIHLDDIEKVLVKLNEKSDMAKEFMRKHLIEGNLSYFSLNGDKIPIKGKLKNYLDFFITLLDHGKTEFEAKEVREAGYDGLSNDHISSSIEKVSHLKIFVEKIEDVHGKWKIRL